MGGGGGGWWWWSKVIFVSHPTVELSWGCDKNILLKEVIYGVTSKELEI